MLSGVAPLSVFPPPPQLRESRTKKYFEILWDVSEINSRINFKPPNPCYLISAATFLYSCVLGIVWSTWKPLCSKNYIGMSPLYELWVKALFSCRADPLFCWQKNTVRTDSLKIVFVIFSSCPNSQSFKCHFLHLPYCTLALCTFTVSDDDILVLLLDLHKCLKAQCKLLSWELQIMNIEYISPPPIFNFDWHQKAAVRERACLIWLGTFLHPLWPINGDFSMDPPITAQSWSQLNLPLDQPSLCPPAKSEWNCRVTCPSTSWTDSVALQSFWIFFRVISYWTQDSDSCGVGYV